ncbi:MAG: diguanylate cyclase (GGDEF)-like protein/PAS domain S-box-containing protein [Motiliproteus sp.]|jgi:diguanylate cyclase (GGDEF)-like protein/PAS domain S-box-containing protein
MLLLFLIAGTALGAPQSVPPSIGMATAPPGLIVAIDDNYPPYIFRDSSGAITGYLVDLWALWQERTGVIVELKASDWDTAQSNMQARRANVIDTMFKTPKRLETFDFSPAYAQVPVAVYSNSKIGGITKPIDLKGFLVGVKAGDACIHSLQQAGVATLKTYASYETLVQAAIEGAVHTFCLDEPPANYLLYKADASGQFRKAFELSRGEFHRAVHKGDALTLRLVNRGFSAITAAEKQALHDKWLGTPRNLSGYAHYLAYALLIAALVAVLLVLWGATLRRQVKRRTAELLAQQTQLQVLLHAIPDLVWMKDCEGAFRFCNPIFERYYGALEADIIGRSDYDFIDPQLADTFRAQDLEALNADQPSRNEDLLSFAENDIPVLVETTKTPVRNAQGEILGILGIAHDITERKAAEAEIVNLAFYDPLTSLPNRRLLADRLQLALASSMRLGREGALLLIDLDHFKTLNDTLGHDKGDLLLQLVAKCIRESVRKKDSVARLGGDEFVVMLEDLSACSIDAANQTRVVAEKVLAAINTPCNLSGQEYLGSASIGITLFSLGINSSEELMKRADLAMYTAKEAGRNNLRFFDPSMQADINARVALETDLRDALRLEQFVLYYQPQLDSSGQVTGAEALIRWRHPQRGLVPPVSFIPLAESTGIILPLGIWVLATACRQLTLWAADPATATLTLAVNISAKQLHQPDFVTQVMAVLQRTGASPRRLKLELTESQLLHNIEDCIAKMLHLRSEGIGFSLDDFGTGYSSLAYLKRLPLEQLKIDQSFVRDVLSDPNDAAIARTIVTLAHSLGLSVIAEGVETAAQRDFLADNECHAYQGYLFSRPVPIAEFNDFLLGSSGA